MDRGNIVRNRILHRTVVAWCQVNSRWKGVVERTDREVEREFGIRE